MHGRFRPANAQTAAGKRRLPGSRQVIHGHRSIAFAKVVVGHRVPLDCEEPRAVSSLEELVTPWKARHRFQRRASSCCIRYTCRE